MPRKAGTRLGPYEILSPLGAGGMATLDILTRQLPDGRVYDLLHIKPSKFDRARVIPIGNGLGRVIDTPYSAHARQVSSWITLPPGPVLQEMI